MSNKKLVFYGAFKIITSFSLHVPVWYMFARQLSLFRYFAQAKAEKITYISDDIQDENFRLSLQLMPGQAFEVMILQIQREVEAAEIIRFLHSTQALSVGIQGLTLVRQLRPAELPIGDTFVFDDKSSLWSDDSGYFIPYIHHSADDSWKFLLRALHNSLKPGSFFICFKYKHKEKPAQPAFPVFN